MPESSPRARFVSLTYLSRRLDYADMVLKYLPMLAATVPGLFASPLEPQGSGSICSSGLYGELAPILQNFALAEAYCSAYFPMKCASVAGSVPVKRNPKTSAAVATTKSVPTVATKATPSASNNLQASALSKLLQQAATAISTVRSSLR
jgi:hypothetical protein